MEYTKSLASDRKNRDFPGLYGLRAFAAIVVFVSNLRHIVPMGGKWSVFDFSIFLESGIGVAFFFVLSGYLLTLDFWKNLAGAFVVNHPVKFVRKRIVRLLPLYVTCLCALVVLKRHWGSIKEIQDTLMHLFLVHNLAEFTFYSVNSPFWTIPVQAQFYLLLPLILFISLKLGRSSQKVFIIILMSAILCYGFHFWVMMYVGSLAEWRINPVFIKQDGFVIGKSILAHLPVFLIGVAGGYLAVARDTFGKCGRTGFFAGLIFWGAAVAALIISSSSFEHVVSLPYARYLFPVLPGVLLVLILFVEASGILWITDSGIFKYLGRISYGIYIFHMPCMKIVFKVMGLLGIPPSDNVLILAVTSFLLTVAVAGILHRYLEGPILNIIKKNDRYAWQTASSK